VLLCFLFVNLFLVFKAISIVGLHHGLGKNWGAVKRSQAFQGLFVSMAVVLLLIATTTLWIHHDSNVTSSGGMQHPLVSSHKGAILSSNLVSAGTCTTDTTCLPTFLWRHSKIVLQGGWIEMEVGLMVKASVLVSEFGAFMTDCLKGRMA